MTEIERRVAAVKATMARFSGKAFAWGRVDCAKLVAFHLRQMGHHESLGLAKAGSYRSALSARRALERAGHASLGAALESVGMVPIPPAAALPGDIIELPGEAAFEALTICVGNGRVFGFHQDAVGPVVLQPVSPLTAWRVASA